MKIYSSDNTIIIDYYFSEKDKVDEILELLDGSIKRITVMPTRVKVTLKEEDKWQQATE